MLCFQSVLYCIVLYNDVFTFLYVAVGNKLLLLLLLLLLPFEIEFDNTVTPRYNTVARIHKFKIAL